MANNNLTSEQGSISFWIQANERNFTPGSGVFFGRVRLEDGIIQIFKDENQKLKVLFLLNEKGTIELEYDITDVDIEKKHMVALTWNKPEDEIILYFDGVARDRKKFSLLE